MLSTLTTDLSHNSADLVARVSRQLECGGSADLGASLGPPSPRIQDHFGWSSCSQPLPRAGCHRGGAGRPRPRGQSLLPQLLPVEGLFRRQRRPSHRVQGARAPRPPHPGGPGVHESSDLPGQPRYWHPLHHAALNEPDLRCLPAVQHECPPGR